MPSTNSRIVPTARASLIVGVRAVIVAALLTAQDLAPADGQRQRKELVHAGSAPETDRVDVDRDGPHRGAPEVGHRERLDVGVPALLRALELDRALGDVLRRADVGHRRRVLRKQTEHVLSGDGDSPLENSPKSCATTPTTEARTNPARMPTITVPTEPAIKRESPTDGSLRARCAASASGSERSSSEN